MRGLAAMGGHGGVRAGEDGDETHADDLKESLQPARSLRCTFGVLAGGCTEVALSRSVCGSGQEDSA